MCGRYAMFAQNGGKALERLKTFAKRQGILLTEGEIFPGMAVPALVSLSPFPRLRELWWGFPSAAGTQRLVINARRETVRERRLFAGCLKERRCAVISTGFFEWSHDTEHRKYIFTLPGKEILYLAGIYREGPRGGELVILTTAANASMEPVHNRMPVIVPQDLLPLWLDDPDKAESLLEFEPPALEHSLFYSDERCLSSEGF